LPHCPQHEVSHRRVGERRLFPMHDAQRYGAGGAPIGIVAAYLA
jgi:hypothetical protein